MTGVQTCALPISSLAFDTIYAEGQRRYIESFSSYARQFLGNFERPDVDRITGLSPVISIEQKTMSKNPRSTVGTTTEIYDFLRLLFARASDAYSYVTGERMIRYTDEQIIDHIAKKFSGEEITVLAPVVKGRKGHYRELLQQILRKGFIRARIDGEITELVYGLKLDRYKIHDIEIVIDRLKAEKKSLKRISESVKTGMQHGKGSIMVMLGEWSDSVNEWENKINQNNDLQHFSRHLICPESGISYPEPEPNTFSFNSPYGSCSYCSGLGLISEIDVKKIIPDLKVSIEDGGIAPIGKLKNTWIFKQLKAIGDKYDFTLNEPIGKIPDKALKTILYGSDEIFKIKNIAYGDTGAKHVSTDYTLNFEGLVSFMFRQYESAPTQSIRRWVHGFMNKIQCPECNGTRLKKESLYFKIGDKNIAELADMSIDRLYGWFEDVATKLNKRQLKIASGILKELRTRIRFLLDIGLGYLSLNRPARSLSGGETQRIRLASQIGSQLVGVLYILDEPSIGLHQKDNTKLVKALNKLRDDGNSVIVVEHDKQMIMSADYIIDMGPGAGAHGGEIVAQGKPLELIEHRLNFVSNNGNVPLTAQYLSGELKIEVPAKRRSIVNGECLTLKGARGNNLKNLDVRFPLGMLICVTGVSGSGKSSLVNETLYPVLSKHFYRSSKKPLEHDSVEGIQYIDKVVEIDQSPIGRTPRSNPATYTGAFTEIRNLFVQLPEAKIRGYKPGRFSFNVKGGRCETCGGAGMKTVEMNFLPDVLVRCEVCNGNRYNRETLEVRYKGKSINDVLNMSIVDAIEFFDSIPGIVQKIKTLQSVGLGYLTLGQPSTTLSGGEAQRVKLAAELAKRSTGKTFYILDEPTTGLHFEDVRVLLDVLNKLVDSGNTIVIIEHNLEVIKVADHIIDLGPEGGEKGGMIVCEGTPEELVRNKKGYTARYLGGEIQL